MARRIALLTLATALVSCDTAQAPLAPVDDPAAAVSPAPRVHVLTAQLRGILDPEIEPSPAWGHVQVKLTERDDGSYGVRWKGRIFNSSGESFLRGEVALVDGDTDPVFRFFRLGAPGIGCDIIDFDSQGITDEEHIPAELALALIIDPDIHEARFVTAARQDGAIRGSFGIVEPATLVGFNPQPDPPQGRQVRCVA